MERYSEPKKLVQHGRPSRHYYVRVRDGDRSTWRTTGQATIALAKEVLATWRMRAAQGERYVRQMTVVKAVAAWLASKEGRIRAVTRFDYEKHSARWVKAWGARRVDSLTENDVSSWVHDRARKLGPRSVNHELVVLRVFLGWCLCERLVRENVAEHTERYKEPERAIRTLTEADEKRLLEQARRENDLVYGYVLCLLTTGFRRRTARELDWRHVDLAAGAWRLPPELLKSGRALVGIPVAGVLLAWLRAHRRAGGRIFPEPGYETWKRLTTLAGLPGLTRHDLRRNFVTRMMRECRDPKTVMAMSDHRDLKVVATSYWGADIDGARAALDRVFADGASM